MPRPDRRVAVAVADASGKGLPAVTVGKAHRPPENIVEAAFAALDEFSGDNQTDDATILAALVH